MGDREVEGFFGCLEGVHERCKGLVDATKEGLEHLWDLAPKCIGPSQVALNQVIFVIVVVGMYSSGGDVG